MPWSLWSHGSVESPGCYRRTRKDNGNEARTSVHLTHLIHLYLLSVWFYSQLTSLLIRTCSLTPPLTHLTPTPHSPHSHPSLHNHSHLTPHSLPPLTPHSLPPLTPHSHPHPSLNTHSHPSPHGSFLNLWSAISNIKALEEGIQVKP